MAAFPLTPIAGINTVAEDAALRVPADPAPRTYVRDALNLDISPQGRLDLRPGARRVTATPYGSLWQSPLHGDVFGTLEGNWVKINPAGWTHQTLLACGAGPVCHEVLNGRVLAAAPEGIFSYDGRSARRFTLDTPGAPLLAAGSGALPAGTYSAAVAWLRGPLESGLSALSTITVPPNGAITLTLPLALDESVTGARVYLTRPDGGEPARLGDWPLDSSIEIPVVPTLGAPAPFPFRVPMPTGQYLKSWRGWLLTARGNTLRFSEALAYHLHDPRHGFVQLPQRITFVQPMQGGIWVGQADHVAFLRGNAPGELSLDHQSGAAPVPGSCTLLDAAAAKPLLGDQAAGGAALWLAANGFVAGSASGVLNEPSAGVLAGIAGQTGSTAVWGRRVVCGVN